MEAHDPAGPVPVSDPAPATTGGTGLETAEDFPAYVAGLSLTQLQGLHSKLCRQLDHETLTHPAGPHPLTQDRYHEVVAELDTCATTDPSRHCAASATTGPGQRVGHVGTQRPEAPPSAVLVDGDERPCPGPGAAVPRVIRTPPRSGHGRKGTAMRSPIGAASTSTSAPSTTPPTDAGAPPRRTTDCGRHRTARSSDSEANGVSTPGLSGTMPGCKTPAASLSTPGSTKHAAEGRACAHGPARRGGGRSQPVRLRT